MSRGAARITFYEQAPCIYKLAEVEQYSLNIKEISNASQSLKFSQSNRSTSIKIKPYANVCMIDVCVEDGQKHQEGQIFFAAPDEDGKMRFCKLKEVASVLKNAFSKDLEESPDISIPEEEEEKSIEVGEVQHNAICSYCGICALNRNPSELDFQSFAQSIFLGIQQSIKDNKTSLKLEHLPPCQQGHKRKSENLSAGIELLERKLPFPDDFGERNKSDVDIANLLEEEGRALGTLSQALGGPFAFIGPVIEPAISAISSCLCRHGS